MKYKEQNTIFKNTFIRIMDQPTNGTEIYKESITEISDQLKTEFSIRKTNFTFSTPGSVHIQNKRSVREQEKLQPSLLPATSGAIQFLGWFHPLLNYVTSFFSSKNNVVKDSFLNINEVKSRLGQERISTHPTRFFNNISNNRACLGPRLLSANDANAPRDISQASVKYITRS